MEQLKCKLAEYSIMYSSKIMWGMDCDLEAILEEMYKIQRYIFILETLQTTNTCNDKIHPTLIDKINDYIRALNRNKNRTCRNC